MYFSANKIKVLSSFLKLKMERNHLEEKSTAEKEDVGVLKMTKSRFILRFPQFARDNLKSAQKFKLNCGFQIDLVRLWKMLQYGKCCFFVC